MIDAGDIPPVADDESLARFAVSEGEFRKDDTPKPALFMPYKNVDLSVNRHLDCTEQEIWDVGFDVATQRKRTLRGRSDILAVACRIETLDVKARPILPTNPNHADVTGYPDKKEDQKSLALNLAAAAGKRIKPPQSEAKS